ncbi:MAG: DUF998 domain-containing protein [Croceitalea sp.]|nr:DUF998 domain-containing protein [Croceitalea sp.]
MSTNTTFFIGILGAGLFVISSIIGGILIDDYSITAQFISETFAIDAQYGVPLRLFAIIPSGVLFTLFAYGAYMNLPQSNMTKLGFIGWGLFYGVATAVVGIFPCDSGCNRELINPSLSQIIHNLIAAFTYMIVPLCILLIAISLRKWPSFKRLANLGILCGTISYLFVMLLFSDPNSEIVGLYQRVIEGLFIVWMLGCAFRIKKGRSATNEWQ